MLTLTGTKDGSCRYVGMLSPILDLSILASAFVVGADLMALDTYRADLLASVRFWVALLLLCQAALASAVTTRPVFVLALALALIQCTHALSPLWTLPAQDPGGANGMVIRLLTSNVQDTNNKPDALLKMIEENSPDIVVLQEADAGWGDALQRTGRFLTIRKTSDFVLASRFVEEPGTIDPENPYYSHRWMRTRLRIPVQDEKSSLVVIYTLQPTSPRNRWRWKFRNAVFDELAQHIRRESEDSAVVVAGDFNTPIWSVYFESFLNRAQLRIRRASSLLLPTYFEKDRGFPVWLGVPIDHVVTTAPLIVRSHTIAQPFGSDHLPVFAEIVVPSH